MKNLVTVLGKLFGYNYNKEDKKVVKQYAFLQEFLEMRIRNAEGKNEKELLEYDLKKVKTAGEEFVKSGNKRAAEDISEMFKRYYTLIAA